MEFLWLFLLQDTHTGTYRRAGTLTQRKQLTHTFYFWAHTHTADTGCLQYGRHLMRTTGTHTHTDASPMRSMYRYFLLLCAEVCTWSFRQGYFKIATYTRNSHNFFFAVELSFLLTLLLDFAMHTFKMKQKTQSAAAAATFTNMNSQSHTHELSWHIHRIFRKCRCFTDCRLCTHLYNWFLYGLWFTLCRTSLYFNVIFDKGIPNSMTNRFHVVLSTAY